LTTSSAATQDCKDILWNVLIILVISSCFLMQVEQQLQGLQQQRVDQLGPTRLYLPIPWQPIIYEQPVTMFKASMTAFDACWNTQQ
jgi:hypothetical protein